MLDKKNPEDEPRQKRSFIRENVVKQPLTLSLIHILNHSLTPMATSTSRTDATRY